MNNNNKALVVIDLQNDITKNYREIIARVNEAIEWAFGNGIMIVYIRYISLSAGVKTFKDGERGAEFVPELKIVSDNIFTKTKGNALTSEAFAEFIKKCGITEFFLVGADATACIKSTAYNMRKEGYNVHIFSDCVTSYDKSKLPKMLDYYMQKGCIVETLSEFKGDNT